MTTREHRSTETDAARRDDRPRLGVSACVLGDRVRFDGGHKRDKFIADDLGRFVHWVPVCPEVEIGLGTPRPTLRLEGASHDARLVEPSTGRDLTAQMDAWSETRVSGLRIAGLDGFVLKKNSPSCGLFRVKVYPKKNAAAAHDGRGIFAARLADGLGGLPIEEEGRLNDPVLRESFVERVFAHRRWQDLLAIAPRARDLVEFHARQKYQLLAHDPGRYGALGRLVASVAEVGINVAVDTYGTLFMECLAVHATRGRHVNVLQHFAGHVSDRLEAADRAELGEIVSAYQQGLVPLVVPLTLLGHHLRLLPKDDWAARQTYLNPYPRELMLRNNL